MNEPPPGFRPLAEDTPWVVERLQVLRWRAMSGMEKLALLDDLSRGAGALSALGARWRAHQDRDPDRP